MIILVFIFDKGDSDNAFYLMLIAWFLGIVSALSNIFLADKINLSKKVFILFVLSSSVWLLPVFLATYFGVPCLMIFLTITVYVHLMPIKNFKMISK